MQKERVDILVVQQGLTNSREKAKRLIMAGQIYDENNERLDKAGEKISIEKQLHIKGETLKYVSRGGLKLEKALNYFNLSVFGKIVLDIGSSTGGFTDVALQNGAIHSYALDVGYNQLHWKLRQDERVSVMERVNFRYSKKEDFICGTPNFVTIDVSFISLKLILPNLATIVPIGTEIVALIKPQFEAGKEKVGKKGIVKDRLVHKEVIENLFEFAETKGYEVNNLTYSPITGGSGNVEFLVHLTYIGEQVSNADMSIVEKVIEEAHSNLLS